MQPDDEFAGAGIWSTPAVDAEEKVAFAGTANPFKPQAEHEYAGGNGHGKLPGFESQLIYHHNTSCQGNGGTEVCTTCAGRWILTRRHEACKSCYYAPRVAGLSRMPGNYSNRHNQMSPDGFHRPGSLAEGEGFEPPVP